MQYNRDIQRGYEMPLKNTSQIVSSPSGTRLSSHLVMDKIKNLESILMRRERIGHRIETFLEYVTSWWPSQLTSRKWFNIYIYIYSLLFRLFWVTQSKNGNSVRRRGH